LPIFPVPVPVPVSVPVPVLSRLFLRHTVPKTWNGTNGNGTEKNRAKTRNRSKN